MTKERSNYRAYFISRNFQSFETSPPVSANQPIYASNPYLDPSVSYMGEMFIPSSNQHEKFGNSGEDFEDEPPLLEGMREILFNLI